MNNKPPGEQEEVKRLAPTSDTVRELYLKSGNQCAFPGCPELIINSEGEYIGQLCHIEAADTNGERFNKDMSNEDRRVFSNLMLMCYKHHVKTNDVKSHPTPVMQQMKADHEAKFTDIIGKIEKAIIDKAAIRKGAGSCTLLSFNKVLDWEHGPEELKACLDDLDWTLERLRKLPERTRQLFSIAAARLARVAVAKKGTYRYDMKVLADEVAEACDIEPQEVVKHLLIIDKYELGHLDNYDEDEPAFIKFRDAPSGWFVIGDIVEYCKKADIHLDAVLVELKFNLLD